MQKIIILLIAFVLTSIKSTAQGDLAAYQRAENYIHYNIDKLVKNLELKPNWIEKGAGFWFKTETDKGYKFLLVTAKNGKKKDAFDHKKLADALAKELNKKVLPDSLPFKKFEYINKRTSIEFSLDSLKYTISLKNYSLTKEKKEKKKQSKNESLSPDGKWLVSVKNYNLYLKSVEGGKETALTTDGIEKYEYATPVSWYKIVDEDKGDTYEPEIDINWSPDSKKFTAYKLDRRKEGKLYMYQSLPDTGYKAKVWSYERSLPGEKTATTKEHFIFDVEKKSKVRIDLPKYAGFLNWYPPKWVENGKKLFIRKFSRGYKEYDLYLVNIETGKIKNLIHDSSRTMVEYQMVEVEYVNEGEKLIWRSERDGWSHLYLYDDGKLINQITKGKYVVRYIAAVDEKEEVIWFVAGGKETGRDPYYKHLYKVNFDGSGLKLLTPEDAEHECWISPNKQYFVDNFSRADQKPKAVLRKMSDGKLIATLQEADITKLLATGWKHPKPFSVKARDGKTDIYGLLFYPSNFDENKKYAVIDGTYSGPQAVRTAKSFKRALRNADVPLAELGFIVMTIDGLGTAWRSKKFHDYSYRNLGDIGAPDHIGGLKQLAKKYPYLDISRVGIYGHSAGGYDAAHALLAHPEFYKVGVASAGNHDIRMSKAWWPEQYQGMPGPHYSEQSNLTLAKNLQGHLLLATGDMDNNVNPANTLRLAAELVKANKDFELVIIPNKDHGGVYYHPYFMRKRWDFFVKHLMGVTPPKYQIKENK